MDPRQSIPRWRHLAAALVTALTSASAAAQPTVPEIERDLQVAREQCRTASSAYSQPWLTKSCKPTGHENWLCGDDVMVSRSTSGSISTTRFVCLRVSKLEQELAQRRARDEDKLRADSLAEYGRLIRSLPQLPAPTSLECLNARDSMDRAMQRMAPETPACAQLCRRQSEAAAQLCLGDVASPAERQPFRERTGKLVGELKGLAPGAACACRNAAGPAWLLDLEQALAGRGVRDRNQSDEAAMRERDLRAARVSELAIRTDAAHRAFDAGKYDLAAAHASMALQVDPAQSPIRVLYLRALLLTQHPDPQRVIAEFRRGPAAWQDEYFLWLADLLLSAGHADLALAFVKNAQWGRAPTPDEYRFMTRWYAARGDWRGALRSWDALRVGKPPVLPPEHQTAYERMLTDARAQLRERVQREPGRWEQRLEYAGVLARSGQLEEALVQSEEASQAAKSGEVGPLAAVADVLVRLGRGEEAVQRVQKALAANPGSTSLQRLVAALERRIAVAQPGTP